MVKMAEAEGLGRQDDLRNAGVLWIEDRTECKRIFNFTTVHSEVAVPTSACPRSQGQMSVGFCPFNENEQ